MSQPSRSVPSRDLGDGDTRAGVSLAIPEWLMPGLAQGKLGALSSLDAELAVRLARSIFSEPWHEIQTR